MSGYYDILLPMTWSPWRTHFVSFSVNETVKIGYYSHSICGYVAETPSDGPVVVHGFGGTRTATHARDAITLLSLAFAPASTLLNQTHEATL